MPLVMTVARSRLFTKKFGSSRLASSLGRRGRRASVIVLLVATISALVISLWARLQDVQNLAIATQKMEALRAARSRLVDSSQQLLTTRAHLKIPHGDDSQGAAEKARSLIVELYQVPTFVVERLSDMDAVRLLDKMETAVRNRCNPSLFIIHVQNGLGNRLRSLASALAIAKGTRRVPLIVWERDAHLGADFDDVLVRRVPGNDTETVLYRDFVVLESFPEWSKVAQRTTHWRPFNYMFKDGHGAKQGEILNFKFYWIRCPRTLWNRLRGNQCAFKTDDIKKHQHVYLKSAYVARARPTYLTPPNRVNAEMRKLVPVQEVVDIVNKHVPKNAPLMYGVHIRSRMLVADNVSVNHRCEYTASAEEMTDYWRAKSQLSEFVNLISYFVRRQRNLHFFVAADDMTLLAKINSSFPGRIHYIPRSCDDRNPQCVRYAFADLLCLARTKRLYGSNWSSFTEAAARLGGLRPILSGVHFGRNRVKSQIRREKVTQTLRTWKVRLVRGWRKLFGSRDCPQG